MAATETPKNSTTPTRTRIRHRFDSNLKISNAITRNDVLGLMRIVVGTYLIK